MATITSDNRAAWQALADTAKAQFPSVGKTVVVSSGRKYVGERGTVIWHGRNQFYNTRYKSDAQLHLMDINGREGFRVRIETSTGDKFYVNAEHVTVEAGI